VDGAECAVADRCEAAAQPEGSGQRVSGCDVDRYPCVALAVRPSERGVNQGAGHTFPAASGWVAVGPMYGSPAAHRRGACEVNSSVSRPTSSPLMAAMK
jgi:hypothetical protein